MQASHHKVETKAPKIKRERERERERERRRKQLQEPHKNQTRIHLKHFPSGKRK
jgi:hypothetical protein